MGLRRRLGCLRDLWLRLGHKTTVIARRYDEAISNYRSGITSLPRRCAPRNDGDYLRAWLLLPLPAIQNLTRPRTPHTIL
ncbi:hypothetical protein FHR99_002261 [Litorivivens lipolytica]|uniref:Uncharacterized protein n=1 Tax=Litorivivens lipolytica TaxID=1524264 RepID=A0A7W4W5U9_9GAMM|nr:hypothetical protein [Litorivivens lipolytica]